MTTIFTEDWVGTDGAAWPAQWAAGLTQNGSNATIVGNTGRMTTGTLGGFAGGDRVSRRYVTSTLVDAEVVTRFRFVNGGCFPAIIFRASDPALDTGNGYYLNIRDSRLVWVKAVAYTRVDLGAGLTHAFTIGSWYNVRARVVGGTQQAKVWADGEVEPAGWAAGLNVADPDITAAGHFGLTVGGGSAASLSVEFDTATVTDGAAPVTSTLAGPTILRRTPAGSWERRKLLTRNAGNTAWDWG